MSSFVFTPQAQVPSQHIVLDTNTRLTPTWKQSPSPKVCQIKGEPIVPEVSLGNSIPYGTCWTQVPQQNVLMPFMESVPQTIESANGDQPHEIAALRKAVAALQSQNMSLREGYASLQQRMGVINIPQGPGQTEQLVAPQHNMQANMQNVVPMHKVETILQSASGQAVYPMPVGVAVPDTNIYQTSTENTYRMNHGVTTTRPDHVSRLQQRRNRIQKIRAKKAKRVARSAKAAQPAAVVIPTVIKTEPVSSISRCSSMSDVSEASETEFCSPPLTPTESPLSPLTIDGDMTLDETVDQLAEEPLSPVSFVSVEEETSVFDPVPTVDLDSFGQAPSVYGEEDYFNIFEPTAASFSSEFM